MRTTILSTILMATILGTPARTESGTGAALDVHAHAEAGAPGVDDHAAASAHGAALAGRAGRIWALSADYSGFAGMGWQGSRNGGREAITVNWLMGTARRAAGAGVLTLRGMASLEPLLLPRDGYPLLLQTGETARGRPLVDRQHPHDLFMELAGSYEIPLGRRRALELYLAAAGEPALGPVAFPHRASAAADPLAPLGHHWMDASHIAFGVARVGLAGPRTRVEVSVFNGREPDESRTDLDLDRLDSLAGRVTVRLAPGFTVQASYGLLREPEALEPGVDMRRLTLSLSSSSQLRAGRLETTLAWGRNEPDGEPASGAFLLEASLTRGRGTLFGRTEYVEKTGHDFALDGDHAHGALPVGGLSLGYLRQVARVGGAVLGLGARAAVGFVEEELASHRYGTSRPRSGLVYLHVRPAGARHNH